MIIQLSGFGGANQQAHPTLLPPNIGIDSLNQKPGRGDLRPWHSPRPVASAPSNTRTIYRAGRDTTSDSQHWFTWPFDVHVTRGFDPDDEKEFTYFTGVGLPKFTTLTDNLLAPGPYPRTAVVTNLGVPAPAFKPYVEQIALAEAATVLDPANWKTYRQYVYTYVTSNGWESQASPVSDLVGDHASPYVAHDVGSFQIPAAGYNITHIRIYMLKGTLGGGANYFFVKEIPTSQTVWRHSYSDGFVGEVLATKDWAVPPNDLTFLTPLWNGMLAGISKGAVRFCESYIPYAWPMHYDVVPPDGKPTGLGVFGQNLLVLTTGRPLLVAGTSPDTLDQQLLEMPQSCISPQSIVSMGHGVAWASNDGLCYYGAGGGKIITAGIMLRDDWQALNPSTIVGCMYEGLYFGSYVKDGFTRGFFIDPGNPQGIYFLEQGYPAMYFDNYQDKLYVFDGTSIRLWDADEAFMWAKFESKRFVLPRAVEAFGWLQVESDDPVYVTVTAYFDSVDEAAKAATTKADKFTHVAGTNYLTYSVWTYNRKPVRLPAGSFRAKDWKFKVETQGSVERMTAAHDQNELRQT